MHQQAIEKWLIPVSVADKNLRGVKHAGSREVTHFVLPYCFRNVRKSDEIKRSTRIYPRTLLSELLSE